MTLKGKRQVIDVPQVFPQYTEHKAYSARCTCGHEMAGEFPAGVNLAISYGANTEAIIAYMYSRQHLTIFQRITFGYP